jgi:hypothetical protein
MPRVGLPWALGGARSFIGATVRYCRIYARRRQRSAYAGPMRAQGTFDVTISKNPEVDAADGVQLGQAGIQKQFHGDLNASSAGRMLSAGGTQPGSAGYVAIERVAGSLGGKRGSFVLQHDGSMDRGKPSLQVRVVPDTGTGELTGLRGSMRIDIVDGKHLYDFDYVL